VRNLITGGSDQLDLTSKCIDISVTPTKVVHEGNVYNVTLLRGGQGAEETIGGVRLVFSDNLSESNFIYDVPGNIGPLGVKTISANVQDISNPNKVDVVVYFLDKSGVQQYCQGAESFAFGN
jgi:hypothetical protein